MTPQEQTDAILSKIRECCPELMELSFGCEITHMPVRDLGIDYRGVYLHPARGKDMHLILFKGERTSSQQTYSTTISRKYFEIVGHEPQLEHLLLTLTLNSEFIGHLELDLSSPNILYAENTISHESFRYNLTLSLTQNLETNTELRKFIYKLICE